MQKKKSSGLNDNIMTSLWSTEIKKIYIFKGDNYLILIDYYLFFICLLICIWVKSLCAK